MCGIVGYIGNKNAVPLLLDGLRRQSYRGYDSSGVVVFGENNKSTLVRAVGELEELEKKVREIQPKGKIGLGHCLAPDTLVFLADGRVVPISEIKQGEEVLSLNLAKKEVEKAQARVTKHKSPQSLYAIRTSFGGVKCTANHRMFVLEKGRVVAKMAKVLKVGDRLISPAKMEIKGRKMLFSDIFTKRYFKVSNRVIELCLSFMKENFISAPQVAEATGVSGSYIEYFLANDRNMREDQLEKITPFFSISFPSSHFVPQNTVHGKFITLPTESSPELMQILGYFLGDGTAQPRTVRFKDTDVDTLKTYQHLIEKVFNLEGRVVPQHGTTAWLLEVNSVYLSKWLHEHVVSRKEKFLREIGVLPREEIAAFLRGLYDAEGSVNLKSRQISLRLTNRGIVQAAQFLLLRIGIISSFYTEQKKVKNWNDSHGVLFGSENARRIFYKVIGFSGREKQQKLSATLLGERRQVPSSKKEQENTLLFTKILEMRQIKATSKCLYDLEVTPNSNFFANGLLSHNSRWATHGGVTEENAHPHQDCKGNIFVVHNGIIENYQQLKEKLVAQGHTFRSETDSEVVPHLLEKFFEGNIEEAVKKAVPSLRGAFALVIIAKEDPGKLIAVRNSAPLLLGIGEGEYISASDPSAVVGITKEVVYLDDNEMAVMEKSGYSVQDINGNHVKKKVSTIDWNIEDAQKGGYEHFMLKEIMEQPEGIADTMRGRFGKKPGEARLGGLEVVQDRLEGIERVHIVGMGTAYLAGLVGEYLISEYARVPVDTDQASEFRYRSPIIDEKTAYLFISQSGETADTLAALREVKRQGGLTLGIINVVGSSVAREVDAGLYNHVGPEIGVASTKAFTSQLTLVALLAVLFANQKGKFLPQVTDGLRKIPELASGMLQDTSAVQKLAEKYVKAENMLYIGRKYQYPIALEGALKLKEISYVHAEGFGGGEVKHGPLALVDERMPTVVLCPSDSVYEKMVSNIQEIKGRGGPVIAVATEGNKEIAKLADDVLYIPQAPEPLTPLLSVIPLQLFAYYMAVLRGHDPDKPRNLAKSVTVE